MGLRRIDLICWEGWGHPDRAPRDGFRLSGAGMTVVKAGWIHAIGASSTCLRRNDGVVGGGDDGGRGSYVRARAWASRMKSAVSWMRR